MSTVTDTSVFQSGFFGVLRGLVVHSFIYPLEVIKIRQQTLTYPENSYRVAKRLFHSEGIGAFYKGLSLQLLKTSSKQVWCWPVIMGIPPWLKKRCIRDIPQQAITGVFIATIDAGITTPLERTKIFSAYTGMTKFSDIYKDGWKGFTTHWRKLSVNWSAFLIAQKHFREKERSTPDQVLTFPKLAWVGAKVAFVVSLVSAPFDMASTLKFAKNLTLSNNIQGYYRGWPLSALSLVVHNVASVFVIEKLEKNFSVK